MPQSRKRIEELQSRLGYTFRDSALLREAVCHRSYINEHPGSRMHHNERLEFLGDGILNFLVGEFLYRRYSEWDEGKLTRARAALVRTETLAEIAREVDLGAALLLGRGEEASQGRMKESLLADTMEAIIAAVYLDGGIRKARTLVRRLMGPRLERPGDGANLRDAKSRLQEWSVRTYGILPRYALTGTEGPDHDKRFCVEVLIGEEAWGLGKGRSKKIAQQAAAGEALQRIRKVAAAG